MKHRSGLIPTLKPTPRGCMLARRWIEPVNAAPSDSQAVECGGRGEVGKVQSRCPGSCTCCVPSLSHVSQPKLLQRQRTVVLGVGVLGIALQDARVIIARFCAWQQGQVAGESGALCSATATGMPGALHRTLASCTTHQPSSPLLPVRMPDGCTGTR